MNNVDRSEEYGVLQEMVDQLFKEKYQVTRLDVLMQGEVFDVSSDLKEVLELLPSGTYTRKRLCIQLNSIIGAHAWGQVYGTVS